MLDKELWRDWLLQYFDLSALCCCFDELKPRPNVGGLKDIDGGNRRWTSWSKNDRNQMAKNAILGSMKTIIGAKKSESSPEAVPEEEMKYRITKAKSAAGSILGTESSEHSLVSHDGDKNLESTKGVQPVPIDLSWSLSLWYIM